MIDRASRDVAADLVEGFADARITNREFEKRWPDSKDRGVLAAESFVYLLYDDFKKHRLTGKHAPNPETQRRLCLIVAFLRTALRYEYPEVNAARREVYPLWQSIATFGLAAAWNRRARRLNLEWEERMKAAGDLSVWPFVKHEDVPAASETRISS